MLKKIPYRQLLIMLFPLLFATGLSVLVRPVLAQLAGEPQDLAAYVSQHEVEVGVEENSGYTRVFYTFNGQKTYVSPEGVNSKHPSTSGKYIVWSGERADAGGQIYRYDMLTESSIQLTSMGSNLRPQVSWNGWVVWESWIPAEDGWQVFLYDGLSIKQLSSGDQSVTPDIDGEQIVFSRQAQNGVWRAVAYSKDQDKTIDITVGDEAKRVTLDGGNVILANGKDVFSLTLEALFLLDKLRGDSRSEPSTVTEEVVAAELAILEEQQEGQEATAEAEPEPSPSAALAPVQSPVGVDPQL
jgi:hypothetical protein